MSYWSDKKTSAGRKLRGLKTAAVAAAVNYTQDEDIYQNAVEGLKPMRSPESYKELAGLGVKLRTLTVPAYARSHNRFVPAEPPREEHITIWEKKAEEGKPHYLVFHATNGHWGDAWPVHNPENLAGLLPREDQERIIANGKLSKEDLARITEKARHTPLEFLEKIAATGAGFTAVSLRGYGTSDGFPSQAAHEMDIKAVVDDLVNRQDIPSKDIAVLGVSLGTWAAAQAAADMTEMNKPPALLGLVNPFANMSSVAASFINKNKTVQRLGVTVDDSLIAHPSLLRHPMYPVELIGKLDPESTKLCILTSSKDELINARNSKRIAKAALKRGFSVHYKPFDAWHGSIPCDALIAQAQEAQAHCNTPDYMEGKKRFWHRRMHGDAAAAALGGDEVKGL